MAISSANNVPYSIAALEKDADTPLVVTANVDINSLIMMPSINDGDCQIKREKKVDENKVRPGSSLAADIREITQSIKAETDCNALQQKVKKGLDGLKTEIEETTKEVKRKLEEIMPILKLPLNPFKIPAWLKKFALGRIFPDLDATIYFIKRTVEVIKALTDLIETVNEVIPRLKACAISTKDMIEQEARNEIDKAVNDLKQDISKAIAKAICEGANAAGITANDIDDVLSAVSSIKGLVDDSKEFKRSVESLLTDSLSLIGQHQQDIQNISGIPPVLDTTSLDAFITSADSPAYTQYKSDVLSVISLPEPVCSVVPAITGTAAVGSTLLCSNGTWTANGVVNNFTMEFQWMREGQEIFGANTFQYIPAVDDVEKSVYCRVRASNQTNVEEVNSPNTAPIVYSMSAGNKPVITGSPINGQTLSCSEGTWPFTPTAVTYEWWRVVTPGSNVRVQSSSSNNTYYCKSADIGSGIKCRVVAQSFRYVLAIDTDVTANVT